MSARAARHAICLALGQIKAGTLVVVEPDGRRRTFGSGAPAATLTVHSSRFWPMLLRGSLGLADAYEQGLWDSPDLVALIRVAARNGHAIDSPRRGLGPLLRTVQLARALRRPTSRRRRRRDVAAHYDLGNELFARMLDPTMTYSCAVFEDPHASLEQAQRAKLDLVCRKLELGPADHVLEIGTGWGSFALHAAAEYGCHVTTTTISRAQHAHARGQVRAAGLEDRIDVLCTDYRDVSGRYDKLVSIEMIEAVGWRHTGTFLRRALPAAVDALPRVLRGWVCRAPDLRRASRPREAGVPACVAARRGLRRRGGAAPRVPVERLAARCGVVDDRTGIVAPDHATHVLLNLVGHRPRLGQVLVRHVT